MSLIITLNDVGRKALSRDGEIWTIVSVDELNATAENSMKENYFFDHNGDFSRFAYDIKNPTDLIAWADERATDQVADQLADQVRPKDLRDEFAMVALQGLVSDPSSGYQYVSPQSYEDGVAKRAYELADAMIRARGK